MNETRLMTPRNASSSRRARGRTFWERSQKPVYDSAAAQAFGEKLAGVLDSAGLALMISLGHRSGLFDALAGQGALGAEQIAKRAKLNERYVREWLGAMVTGGIVTYDPNERRYELPAEHAACLTRAAAPNNMAATMQWIPVLGGVEDGVLEAFRHGDPLALSIEGEDVLLPPRVSTVMAMALHELATNALKHGALSVTDGRVSVRWEAIRSPETSKPVLHVVWHESGGPPVAAPTHHGFGLELIKGGLSYESHGRVDITFHPTGLRCDICVGIDDPDHAASTGVVVKSGLSSISGPLAR